MSETIEILSAVHGIAPRSDELLKLGVDFEKGRATQAALDERIAQETNDWLLLQVEAGINLREDGKLTWQDHLRPLVKATTGFASGIDDGPITRWFEDNRFYRKPSIVNPLRLNSQRFLEGIDPQNGYVSLLSPLSFARLCDSELKDDDTQREVFSLYDQTAQALRSIGVDKLLLEHYVPSAATDVSVKEDLAIIAEQVAHYYSQYGINIHLLVPGRNLNLGTKRTDFATDFEDAPQAVLNTYEFVIQSIEAKSTHPDSELIDPLHLHKPDTYSTFIFTHDFDLEHLPLLYARDKVKRLGEFAAQLKEQLEEH